MSENYNHMPAGAMVCIHSHTGKLIAKGALLEDFKVNMRSEFVHVLGSGNTIVGDAANVFLGALKSMSSGLINGSASYKQMGALVWRHTDNFAMSFSLEFHYTYDAMTEVVRPIEAVCELALPGETRTGNLQMPGPSILEALHPSFPNMPPSSRDGIPVPVEDKEDGCDTYINITIGNLLFMGWVIVSAEPTYSKFLDEDGVPIYAKVAVEAKSVHSATKDSMRRWAHS